MDQIGGRKFMFALVVVIAGFVLVLMNKCPAQDWFNFAELIGGIYVAGNVGERITDALSKPQEPSRQNG